MRFWISPREDGLVPAVRGFSWFSSSRAGDLRLWCRTLEVTHPLKTIPGGYVVTPQSPPGDTKGERLSQLDSWSCPPSIVRPLWVMVAFQGLHRSTGQDIVSASLHPGGSSISSPRSLICSTGRHCRTVDSGLVSKDTEAGVQTDTQHEGQAYYPVQVCSTMQVITQNPGGRLHPAHQGSSTPGRDYRVSAPLSSRD